MGKTAEIEKREGCCERQDDVVRCWLVPASCRVTSRKTLTQHGAIGNKSHLESYGKHLPIAYVRLVP